MRPMPAAGPMLRMPRTSDAVSSIRSDQYSSSPQPIRALRRAVNTLRLHSFSSPSSACRMSWPAASCDSDVQAIRPSRAFDGGMLTTAASTSNVLVESTGQVYGPSSGSPT